MYNIPQCQQVETNKSTQDNVILTHCLDQIPFRNTPTWWWWTDFDKGATVPQREKDYLLTNGAGTTGHLYDKNKP